MRKILIALLFLILFGLSGLVFIYMQLTKPLPTDTTMDIIVIPGDSVLRLANQLKRKNQINHKYWLLAAHFFSYHRGTTIQAGRYKIKNDSLLSLITKIKNGTVTHYSFTIIPGWNKYQLINNLIARNIICNAPPAPLQPKDYIQIEQKIRRQLDLSHNSIEGLFLADTYHYRLTCSLEPLVIAHQKLNHALTKLWQTRKANLPYKDTYQALTMSSIIEKETGVASERPLIAAAFVGRIAKNMRLQTDPTVIYGLGLSYNGNITRQHLIQETPYNTYKIKGLPPTPISMVSEDAISAALQPANSNFLFFVGKGDGTHYFSTNYEAHKKAVARYQVHRRTKNYQSSPKAQQAAN